MLSACDRCSLHTRSLAELLHGDPWEIAAQANCWGSNARRRVRADLGIAWIRPPMPRAHDTYRGGRDMLGGSPWADFKPDSVMCHDAWL
jgi:hypothetical protein